MKLTTYILRVNNDGRFNERDIRFESVTIIEMIARFMIYPASLRTNERKEILRHITRQVRT